MRGIKFIKEREDAIKLRRKGLSIRVIEKRLGINRSTVGGWLRDVKLTAQQKRKLHKDWENGLIEARKKAVKWHNAQKSARLEDAKKQSDAVLQNLNFDNSDILDLVLAFLYFGEGFKTNEETGIGNADPLILKTFLYILRKNYKIDTKSIRCELYLRADQNGDDMKSYWSKELDIPVENFKQVNFDKRTIDSKTYSNYHGVCSLRCANVAIKRKLINISRDFCERLIKRT